MLKPKKYEFGFFIHLESVDSYVSSNKELTLVKIEDLMFTHSATTSKKAGMTSHNKDMKMDFKLKNFEFGYNTFFLVMLKSMFYIQIVFNNYNFATYKEYMKRVVKVLQRKGKKGKIDVKKANSEVIVEGLDLYLKEERERAFSILTSPKKVEKQRKMFEPERGLYEITQTRTYNLESGVVKLYDMENKVNLIF